MNNFYKWLQSQSLAMQLTMARFYFLPFLWFSLSVGSSRNWLSFGLFLALALTDWADGYIARRYNQTSLLGAVLDHVADKTLVCSALILMAFKNDLSVVGMFAALIIVTRELAVLGLREYAAKSGQVQKAHVGQLGKFKAALQMVALILMLWPAHNMTFFANALLFLAAILAAVSGFRYTKAIFKAA